MIRLWFRQAARQEFRDAALWYERQRRGLGLSFTDEVDRILVEIRDHPLRFPRVHGNIRRAQTKRFPYSIFFLSEQSRVVILAVFHARRDPLVWKSR